MAGRRVGLVLGSTEISDSMKRVKQPYNGSGIAQTTVVAARDVGGKVKNWMKSALQQREVLAKSLGCFDFVKRVYTSDANFILVKVTDANAVYRFLLDEKVVVRNRNNVELCEGCLRITVGTSEENSRLLTAWAKFE